MDFKSLTPSVAMADSPTVTMTSLELVEFINSERGPRAATLTHADFLKKVPQVLGGDEGNFSSVYMGGNGQERPCYRFPKREACLMAMSYSYDLQAKVFDRMTALEAGATTALNLADPASLRTLLLGYTEKVLELQTTVAAQAPKVAFADAVGNATNTQTVSQVAKVLGIGPRKLFDFLRTNGILMVNNLPFQHHIECGRFRVIEVPYKDGDGADRIKPQARVTGKGVTFIQQRLAKSKEVAHG